jgi:polyisoprenyl-phosphate glycosyltransferase
MKLSVIVPAYNEGSSVKTARDAITEVMRNQLPDFDYEIIFVDDGSSDDTFVHLSELCSVDPAVRAIKFAVNSGSHMAIRAGFEHARGDIACYIPCDLQDPPDVIPEMLALLKEPVQVVWAVRNSRDDKFSTRLFANLFYLMARKMISKNFPPSGVGVFLLGPLALKAMHRYRERNLTVYGLFATMGYKTASILYDRRARLVGQSKWTMGKRIKLFADFFVGHSYIPIRMMSLFGFGMAGLGFLYALVVLINKIFFYNPVDGYASLAVIVLVVGGIQLIMMGITGEYIWRTLDEVRARPRYLIDEILNDEPNVEVVTQTPIFQEEIRN